MLAPCQPAASSIEQVVDLAEILKATGVPFGVAVRDARTDTDRPDPGAITAWQQVADLAAEIETKLN